MGETQGEQGRDVTSGSSRWVWIALVVLGTVIAVTGLVLLLLPSGQTSFGWFAYAPLSSEVFVPSVDQLTSQRQIGIVLLVVGLASLSFGAGWALGRRHTAGQRRMPDAGSPDGSNAPDA
jgi:heme/copper-type cytochrome/quinol oxidase subunit 1